MTPIVYGKTYDFEFSKDNYMFTIRKGKDLLYSQQLKNLNNKLTIVLPHPSPLNMRWFKANPGFENRLVEIRKIIAAYCDLK